MKAMLDFLKHLIRMPIAVRVWVAVLMLVNMGAFFFLPRPEAWVVLGALVLGGVLQALIFSRKGFVRLLGLGHVHWLLMFVWIYSRIETIRLDPVLFGWILLLTMVNGVSLIIDIADIVRYLRGEKEPTVP